MKLGGTAYGWLIAAGIVLAVVVLWRAYSAVAGAVGTVVGGVSRAARAGAEAGAEAGRALDQAGWEPPLN